MCKPSLPPAPLLLFRLRLLSSSPTPYYRLLATLRATSSKLPVKLTTSTSITTPSHALSPPVWPRIGAVLSCEKVSSAQASGASMASDQEYMAFLDKANQDLDDGKALTAKQSKKPAFKTMDEGSQPPKVIRDACQGAVFVTDADEPFEEVSLKWSGDGLPDETEFAKLIKHWDADKADISIMDPVDWDSEGRYAKLIEAVREATKGNDVRVYSVTRDKTRTEYWLVSREEERIVGVKALGVES
ncbi:hypothetical protein NOR_04402 [Metarhizium rileyi]|uniref:Uncharacterized protein n=1 Tax=Metarhizium rileyi (strain RCEF 4871) TaxID=1649241 RepID=A0A167EFA8_METRR|nr:hypothetical protein NOR_04402 [Metarhizium rileyi RCEF 4871]TWU78691.1 hypothetical protein ED733_005990 [Metarhizium rileyi]